jgi:hypothetical protein
VPFNSIFAWVIKKRLHQIELFTKYPLEVQEELLQNLLQQGRFTEFGKLYQFNHIIDYPTFQASVPLQDYESLKPFIDRSMKGEQNCLWPGETKWFAKSSGTTNDRSKFIPVTTESLEGCHYKGGKDLLALYYNNFPNRKLYKGKHLIIGGSTQILPITEDSYHGDLSAIIVKNLPWWAEIRRTPSREIALLSEWNEKLARMAESTKDEDVYILAGVPSWTLLLCQKVLEITGKKNLREVWPNLELFMHGGVSFEPYQEAYKKIIPFDDMHYVETYNASEGFFGIQNYAADDSLLLMLDYGIFYEFIPISTYSGVSSKTVVSLSGIEIGQEYAMVITTNGGLWRYILGDTVKFTSKNPFKFKIAGRTSHFINAFGEEVSVSNAEQAIAHASRFTHAQIREYTCAPVMMNLGKTGCHEWMIEFSIEPNDFHRFGMLLDEKLRELNSDYDAKRYQNMILNVPKIHMASANLFESWLEKRGKLGGQHKVPRLQNNRIILEELLEMEQLLRNTNVKKSS